MAGPYGVEMGTGEKRETDENVERKMDGYKRDDIAGSPLGRQAIRHQK